MALTINGSNVVLPNNVQNTIVRDAVANGVFASLATKTPVTMGNTEIPVYNGGIEAGVVAEGARKPTATPQLGRIVMRPVKLAVVVPVSEEFILADKVGTMNLILQDTMAAIGRAVDYGVVYGKDMLTGNAIANVSSFKNDVTNVAGAYPDEPGGVVGGNQVVNQWLQRAVMEGYNLASAVPGSNVDTLVLDNSLKLSAAFGAHNDVNGNGNNVWAPIANNVNITANVGTYLGLRTAFSQTVSGKANQGDGIDGIIGDFSALRFGAAMDLNLKSSDTASFTTDSGEVVSAFESNFTLFRAETIVGWAITDPRRFAKLGGQN